MKEKSEPREKTLVYWVAESVGGDGYIRRQTRKELVEYLSEDYKPGKDGEWYLVEHPDLACYYKPHKVTIKYISPYDLVCQVKEGGVREWS